MTRDALRRQARYFAMWSGWIRQARVIDVEHATRFTPPPVYRAYHQWLLAQFDDAGKPMVNRDFDGITWYRAPFIPKRLVHFTTDLHYPEVSRLWGIWIKPERAIILLEGHEENAALVRHEMTHDMRGIGGHEPEFFAWQFGNVL